MSNPKIPPSSSYGRRRTPFPKLTFFDRHYRAIHHIGVILGVSAFFGPLVYRYLNPPPFDEALYRPGAPRPDYARIEKELDKWR